MRRIEEIAMRDGQHLKPVPERAAIVIKPQKRYGYLTLLRVAFGRYPRRAILVTGLIFLAVGPVDASAYVSGLAAAAVVVAFVVVLRTLAPRPRLSRPACRATVGAARSAIRWQLGRRPALVGACSG